jgi:hypothetical protein
VWVIELIYSEVVPFRIEELVESFEPWSAGQLGGDVLAAVLPRAGTCARSGLPGTPPFCMAAFSKDRTTTISTNLFKGSDVQR